MKILFRWPEKYLLIQVEVNDEGILCPPCSSLQFFRFAGGDKTGSIYNKSDNSGKWLCHKVVNECKSGTRIEPEGDYIKAGVARSISTGNYKSTPCS